MIAPEHNNDRYIWQTKRQNMGKPCTDCGSMWGHYVQCPMFHKGLPTGSWREEDWSKPQPDSQSFYRKAQKEVKAHKVFEQLITEGDSIEAHGLGVKL